MSGVKKNLLFILLVVAAFVIGALWTKISSLEEKKAGQVLPQVEEAEKIRPVSEQDHLLGDKNAPVTLVVYSDLECPYCKTFHQTLLKALNEYEGKIRLAYRHFPLDQIHPKARKEAQATECAAELGGNEGFWKMVDKIFEVTPSNNGLNLDDLPSLASQIGLDPEKFRGCLESGKFGQRVEEDYQDGVKGVGKLVTPATIIIDAKGKSKLIPGALPYDSLKQTIEEALKS